MTEYVSYKRAPYQVRIVNYRCERCFRRWQSANGSLSDYQLCKSCLQKCYPGTYKWQAPNKKGNQNPETFIAHNTELCGKCIRLGFSCMELGANEDEDKGGIVVNNIEGDEITLEKRNLSNFIQITENTHTKSKKNNKKPVQQTERRKSVDKKAQRLKERQETIDLLDAEKKKKKEDKVVDMDKKNTDSNNNIKTHATSSEAKDDKIIAESNNDTKELSVTSINSFITESVIHSAVIDSDNVENATSNTLIIMESSIDYAVMDKENDPSNSTGSISNELIDMEKVIEHLSISDN